MQPLTIFIIQRKGLYIGALAAVAAAAAQSVIECVAVLPLQLLAAVAVVAFRCVLSDASPLFSVSTHTHTRAQVPVPVGDQHVHSARVWDS